MKKAAAARGKRHATQQSLNAAIKSICDIMRRSNCAGALQYVPELTWILFLRILDEIEEHEAENAAAVRASFRPSLAAPYRWRDWARPDGAKRKKLESAATGAFFSFINGDLIPHLKTLKTNPNATSRQKVISEIMSGVDRTRIDTERNFKDILDKVGDISTRNVDDTHVFTLSQVYEGLLLKMGEKGNDGGQFFTPREENLIYPIALANLILHGIDEPHLWHGNTLTGDTLYGGLYEHAPARFESRVARTHDRHSACIDRLPRATAQRTLDAADIPNPEPVNRFQFDGENGLS